MTSSATPTEPDDDAGSAHADPGEAAARAAGDADARVDDGKDDGDDAADAAVDAAPAPAPVKPPAKAKGANGTPRPGKAAGKPVAKPDADDDDEEDDDAAAPAPPDAAREPWWSRHLPTLMAAAGNVVGWSFIGWHYRFRVSPAMVFLMMGWLAVVSAVLFLWRTAFAATDDADEDLAWWRPSGATDDLVREKKSLLKAIKEIEFDRELGKMTNQDAEQIIHMYKARAIEVIKAIDLAEAGQAGAAQTTRDKIEREVRARRELGDDRAKKKAKKAAAARRAE
ncbi:MAG: hypothetical protein K8W52_12730 [Deltaproteobacteria bacterium]|nr:hypothetical protein [Deltaproteobacteria bacterium]